MRMRVIDEFNNVLDDFNLLGEPLDFSVTRKNGVLVDGHFYKETDDGYEQALAVLGARRVEKC